MTRSECLSRCARICVSVASLAASVLLGACATSMPVGDEQAPSEIVPRAQVASADVSLQHRAGAAGFIDALTQLPGFLPASTALTFERLELAEEPFLRALRSQATSRGYAIRVAAAGAGENMVRHVAEIAADGQVTRTVSFGQAQMRRRFVPVGDGRWNSASSLFIRGIDASGVVLGGAGDATRAATLVPAAIVPTAPVDAPVAIVATDIPDARTPEASAAAAGVVPPIAAAVDAPRNVAELGQSNYAGVFEQYANVEEIVLVFPNDSMVLGATNKKTIHRTVEEVDPERDLFSILGCSFGKSAIENGNEVLATGRAERVKQELLYAGVASERILDEGCWAGAPEENFPGRGVVLTVKRVRS